MTDAIVVALIAGGCSIIVGILSVITQLVLSRRQQIMTVAELDKRSEISDSRIDAKIEQLASVTNIKLDELTREVREHNNFAKRVPLLELQVEYMDKQIASMQKTEPTGK